MQLILDNLSNIHYSHFSFQYKQKIDISKNWLRILACDFSFSIYSFDNNNNNNQKKYNIFFKIIWL